MFLFLWFLSYVFGNNHINGHRQHLDVERRVVEVFAFGFHLQGMWRNGNNVNVLPFESLYLVDFIDETTIVKVFYIGSELEDRDFLDDCDIKQTIVWDGIGHGHHTTSVETSIPDGKVEDIVVKHKFIIDGELDMGDFVSQDAFHQADEIADCTTFALLFQVRFRRH